MDEKDSVFIFDMYSTPNYPNDHEAKKGISANIPLELHLKDKAYLSILEKRLPECLDKFKPDLLFYNAGTDILVNDALVLSFSFFSVFRSFRLFFSFLLFSFFFFSLLKLHLKGGMSVSADGIIRRDEFGTLFFSSFLRMSAKTMY